MAMTLGVLFGNRPMCRTKKDDEALSNSYKDTASLEVTKIRWKLNSLNWQDMLVIKKDLEKRDRTRGKKFIDKEEGS